MKAQEIRGRLIAKAGSIEAVAAALNVNRTALSMVINYTRATEHIRVKLHTQFGIRFNDSLLRVDASKRKGANPTRQTKRQAKKKRGSK